MSNSPTTWMPLFIGDYLSDTMHLDAESHGAYLLLIMHYWRNGGPLKNDKISLSNVSKISTKKCINLLEEFFEFKDGYWHHKRIDGELSNAMEKKEKRTKQTEKARAASANKSIPVTDPVTEDVTESVTALRAGTPSPSPYSDTNVSGEYSPPPDLKKTIFDAGLNYLAKQTNKPPDKLRPVVGKWISRHGEEKTLSAIMDAQRASAIEPVSYIEQRLSGKKILAPPAKQSLVNANIL